MAHPRFSSRGIETPVGDAVLVAIDIPGGITTPIEFADSLVTLHVPVPPQCGVILSGRMPIWAAGMLFHLFHPTIWVASYDPRLGGAVVTQRHTEAVALGQVILLDLPEPSL